MSASRRTGTARDAAAALARVDALHTALTHIVLEGGDLARIAEEVGRVLGCGVLVTSTDGRERAAHLDDADRAVLADYDLVDPTGRVRVERIAPDGSPVGQGEVRALRVAAGGTDLARLVSVRREGRIAEDDVHALERGATVAALLITREESITAVENKYQGDFLRELFARRARDTAYVEEHVASFGWSLERPGVVVVAQLDPVEPATPPPSSHDRRRFQERFSAAWRQVTQAVDPGIPCVDFSSEVVAVLPVLPVKDTDAGRPGADAVERSVASVAGDKGGGRRSFSVGVSRPASALDDLPDCYSQARRAVEVGRLVSGPGATTYFDQLGLHRLIALVPDQAELRAFAHDVLGPLAERTPEAADLRETLQVLLDTNFNVAEAARLQFFHYNTMRYRVGKLERLLGPLSSDPHVRLDVAVALRVLEISG
ncbi:PucR family transcriptional regulator [Nocardioides sp.]|uniref:PucR family transcriptional regulator n=1 Tax=Nocardioides sp. TaxID=35761 RepID=UPI002ED35F19